MGSSVHEDTTTWSVAGSLPGTCGKALRPRSLRPESFESSIDNSPMLQLTVVAGAQSSELSMQQRAAVPSAPGCARGARLRAVGSVLRELQLHRRKEVVDLPELTICRSHTNNRGRISESLARMWTATRGV